MEIGGEQLRVSTAVLGTSSRYTDIKVLQPRAGAAQGECCHSGHLLALHRFQGLAAMLGTSFPHRCIEVCSLGHAQLRVSAAMLGTCFPYIAIEIL